MADRTQDAEEKLTGNRPPAASDNTGRTVTAGAHQEGRVDSVGGRPSGTDTDDRTAEGKRRGEGRTEEGRSPDAFVSSEVSDRVSQPMKDPKTRS